IRAKCKIRVEALRARTGVAPGLAVVLVGEDPASKVYVRNKIRACEAVGIASFSRRLPVETTTAELLTLIERLNVDPAVHGILVQLPLLVHIVMRAVLEAISADKDVDGFHLYNVGGLILGDTAFPPCTPYGVVKLLESENI